MERTNIGTPGSRFAAIDAPSSTYDYLPFLVLPVVYGIVRAGIVIALVKPQFELERRRGQGARRW